MPASESIPVAAWAFYALLVSAGMYVYGRVAWRIARQGGKVAAEHWGFPELLMSFVLAATFILLTIGGVQRQAKDETPMKIEHVLPGSIAFLILCVGIFSFLHFVRRLPTRHIFGLDQVHPLTALGWAAGLCLAILPLTYAVSLLTMFALKDNVAPQPLVQLFSEVARNNDYLAIAKIFFVGAIVAPACEEFLFRGFCYPIWKRYIGPIGSALLASLLFAALHTSLTAFASLFLLALCLNLAYERTGSLLVPIGIHAAFNSFSLLILYTQRFTVAPVSP